MKEPKAMKEIHKIREKRYKMWRGKSREEIQKMVENGAEEIRKEIEKIRAKHKISV